MSREAMKLAYEALRYASYEDTEYDDVCAQKVLEARRALRQALKTEQKPVAWASSLDFDDDNQEIIPAKAKGKLGTSNCDIPLYTEPPKQWVGLTDKEIDECYFAARQPDFDVWEFAAEIEEVLKKKNTHD